MNSKQLGALGEKIAENYLKKKGYQILDKNYSSKFVSGPKIGEIDIIAKKEDTISFIEVKTLTQNNTGSTAERSEAGDERSSATTRARRRVEMKAKPSATRASFSFSPEEKVDYSKQKKLIKMAESWLMKKRVPLNSKWQVDVVAIKIDLNKKKARLSHFKNIGF